METITPSTKRTCFVILYCCFKPWTISFTPDHMVIWMTTGGHLCTGTVPKNLVGVQLNRSTRECKVRSTGYPTRYDPWPLLSYLYVAGSGSHEEVWGDDAGGSDDSQHRGDTQHLHTQVYAGRISPQWAAVGEDQRRNGHPHSARLRQGRGRS